ncbi:MAG: D-sedoheptulose 7-phosphate isomerase [candidate division Zixibacteria bacterium]|nr:D-sedoheptulose 7-phosphate isomerase [candidate division Zixibacteria bacterium]
MAQKTEEKLNSVQGQIEESIVLKNKVKDELSEKIVEISEVLAECIKNGGKILLCGNGGSAADAQHFAGELVVRLSSDYTRSALPAITLSSNDYVLTACANDFGFEQVFSRQIEALGKPEDVLLCISTSGNSPNLIKAIEKAKEKQMKTIGLLGKDGGRMVKLVDFSLVVPSQKTPRIQEVHITICHILTSLIEKALFD